MAASALCLAARGWLLINRPLWHDEIFTIWVSRLAPSELIRALRSDSGPPLFYFLERPFVAGAEAFALPDTVARLLPFVSVLLLSLVAARSLPGNGGRPRFLLLAATSPLLLLYSAEARAYAPLSLLGLLLFLLVVRQRREGRGLAAIALTAALALWMHYLAILLVASLLVAAVWERRRRCALALAAGAALFLPWVPALIAQPKEATSWMRESLPASGLGLLASLGGVPRVPLPLGTPFPAPLLWIGALTAIALAAGLLALGRAESDVRIGSEAVLLTLGGALAVSFWRPLAFAGRSEMAVLPIWLWVVAEAASKSRMLRWAASAAMVLGTAGSVLLLAAPRPVPRSLAMTLLLERVARPGDVVFAGGSFYLPARLASDRGEMAAAVSGFPADLERHPGWFVAGPPADSDYARVERTLESEPAGARVFLLLHPKFFDARLRRILSARGTSRELFRGSDAELIGWSASP